MRTNTFLPKPCAPDHCRFIGRCTAKACKFCKAADVELVEETRHRTPPFGANFWPYGQFQMWKEEYGTYTAHVPQVRQLPAVICPTHNRPLRWDRVEGRVSESRKCDPRCTGAIGPNCECACGGANHGCDNL